MGRSSLRGATQLERQCLSAFFSVTLKCACSRRRLRGVPSALQCAAFSRGSTLFDRIWPDFFPSLPVFSYYKRKKPRCQQNSEFRMKNSELGFVGDERLYLSYSFPVERGETMEGLCPLHPHKGHRPLTQSRNWQSVSHKQFPGEMEHRAHKFSQMKIVSLRAGCGTAATQKPLCKRTNETLRIGCGTAAHAETPLQR